MSLTEDVDNSTTPLSTLQTIGLGVPDSPAALQLVNYCLGVALLIIALTGSLGNGLVLYVTARYSRLRIGGGSLISNLAGADLVVSLLHIPSAYSSFNESWAFGSFGCNLYAASLGLCRLTSLQTLTAIAADRYFVIIGRRISWLAKRKTCAGLWALSLCLVLPPFVGWSQYRTEGMGTSCSWDYQSRDLQTRLYYLFLLTFGFILPVAIITFSYAGILRNVWKRSLQVVIIGNGLGPTVRTPAQMAMKTAKMIFVTITCFLVSGTPYAIVSAVGQFGTEEMLPPPLATELAGILAKASVVVNPIVYGLSHPKFRSAVRMLKSQSRWWAAIKKGTHHVSHNYIHHNELIVYKQEPHCNNQHVRCHNQNHMFGDRKWGLMPHLRISIQENCYDEEPGESSETSSTGKLDRRRSTMWYLHQAENSKAMSEVRATPEQKKLLTPSGVDQDDASCHTLFQLHDATVTPTRTSLRDAAIMTAVDPLLYHSAFGLHAHLVSSSDVTAVSMTLPDEAEEGDINCPESREPEQSLRRFISKNLLGNLINWATANDASSKDQRIVSITALAKGKGYPASQSPKNCADLPSENCFTSPCLCYHRNDQRHRNHQVCPTSPMRRKFNTLEFPRSQVPAEDGPRHHRLSHHRAVTSLTASSSSRPRVEKTASGIDLVSLRTERTATKKAPSRERRYSRKRSK